MKKYFLVLSLFVALFACQNESKLNQDSIVVVNADAKAILKISGMVCQNGCANHISQEISQIEGVSSCSVNFLDSSAVISFDNSLVSEIAFVDFINSTNDSAYSVMSIDVELIKKAKTEKIQTH